MAQHQYYCEECGKHLFDSEKDGGAAGAEAQQKSFVFKMPILFGIDGCHFFYEFTHENVLPIEFKTKE